MAENGVTGIFMVSSVMAVPVVKKVKKEPARAFVQVSKDDSSADSFAQALDQAVAEQTLPQAPTECYTVTYGRDSRLRRFIYQPRDYHF